jgi:glycosyltransferase involved in cell wall biosynthesis
MVSTEYPPMQGGVGRYCKKLVDSLRNQDVEVRVVCNEDGQGDYAGISPLNPRNSDILLKIVEEYEPDLVHVQYEPGLYGIHLDPLNPNKTCTNIEPFYRECKVPIVTTFHSAYTFRQWMSLVVPLVNKKFGKIGTWLRVAYDYWTHILNYRSFKSLNTQKIGPNRKGIVFSRYLANLIPGSQLIYHGSEPSLIPAPDKREARRKFSLPEEGNIALALGFLTATKGLDIIRKMKVPAGWKIVVNTSRNHYNMEKIKEKFDNEGVIELGKGFLADKELSLLLYSADALILPYKVSSGSGVMYDGLAHGLPFVSSNIEFFKEFSNLGLGISVERDPIEFSKAFLKLERDYDKYENAVEIFRRKLVWKEVAKKHISLYESIMNSAEDIQVLEKYV